MTARITIERRDHEWQTYVVVAFSHAELSSLPYGTNEKLMRLAARPYSGDFLRLLASIVDDLDRAQQKSSEDGIIDGEFTEAAEPRALEHRP